ncbi:hypothetical protein M4R23_08910 [Acidovorax sp. GBBC 3332]|nr:MULTISPECIES: hypothetical protein [unclassified Acidovorax]MDA8449802.1 hypothetical protein [Acidovorax sp. GBBC 3297]MDA8459247.1 hypothetical protein [Acidovorax sp. GBBC 3333]MDA8464284.1 hypothetical protein [Acidovorax sp. GBBC 3332]MDA8469506.1 hypothetical protein [Acidovorax sp. GBBC 3299]
MTHADTKLSVAASVADKPEALRCAEWLEHIARGGDVLNIDELAWTAAAQLRRLHALTASPSQAQAPALMEGRAHLAYTLTAESGYEQTGEHRNITPEVFGAMVAMLHGKQPDGDGWEPIQTAPKSRADGSDVHGIYLQGYVPDPDICNLESCICVVWWEPLMNKGRGLWYGEGGHEVMPTHWRPLPAPPAAARAQAKGGI